MQDLGQDHFRAAKQDYAKMRLVVERLKASAAPDQAAFEEFRKLLRSARRNLDLATSEFSRVIHDEHVDATFKTMLEERVEEFARDLWDMEVQARIAARTAIEGFRDYRSLGVILMRMRREAGLRQEDIAQRLDVSPAAIVHFEKGARRPTIDKILDWADESGFDASMTFRRRGARSLADRTASAVAVLPGWFQEVVYRLATLFEAQLADGREQHAELMATTVLAWDDDNLLRYRRRQDVPNTADETPRVVMPPPEDIGANVAKALRWFRTCPPEVFRQVSASLLEEVPGTGLIRAQMLFSEDEGQRAVAWEALQGLGGNDRAMPPHYLRFWRDEEGPQPE